MKVPNKILIDADAMVALVNPDDPSHAIAEKLGGEIDGRGVKVIISDPAFGEALTVISQDTSLEKAILFAERTLASSAEIVEVDSVLRRAGLDILKRQTSKNTRFTDCINMAVMKRERIDTIFSFDKHYKKNGFKRFGIDE
ncbi:MAG: hypothetical protein A2782_01070 [Candidatus Blackburnbacteria bacterium RIFCSPHIGHO2_01_FULL_43_15b]|uniref:Ribonuclease VapC n=1 Tax=Candidatus Blackburnbacteria bacterium RIFCSPHIGHO2_01_FULL_43_15b TaxID=1797513 RepID=A0A1G1V1Y2_9BACT|nr:MAG: hypothetical protein A2782_01070 [Candidatus Blackburnbacteria bacterium RIFCSPHIGHO2_01_FULL_43_15b]